MYQSLRPALTPGFAVAGAAMIALVPATVPLADAHSLVGQHLIAAQHHSVTLTSDPANDVTALLTGLGVLPSITVNAVPLPAHVDIELGGVLHGLLAAVGPIMTLSNAWNDIVAQLVADPSNAFSILFSAPGALINAFLFGSSGIDVAGMNIPLFSGLFVAPHTATVDLHLGQLVDMAGVGTTTLGDLLVSSGLGNESLQDLLSGLLDSLGVGHMSLTGVLSEFGIGDQPIASLASSLLDSMGIGNTTIAGLAEKAGLSDESIAQVLTDILGQAGVGNPTLVGLLDQAGIGQQTLGELATGLLHAAGMNDTTITGIVGELGIGNLTVGEALKELVNSTAGPNATVTDVLDHFGGANLTLGNLIDPVLASSGLGQQSLANVIDTALGGILGQPPSSDLTMGELVIDILQKAGYDLTLTQVLQDAQMSDMKLGDLLSSTPIGQEKFTDILTMAGYGDQTLRVLMSTGGVSLPVPIDVACFALPLFNLSCDQTLNSLLGPNTLYQTLHNLHSAGAPSLGVAPGTAFTDLTLGQLLSATGEGDVKLSHIITGLDLDTPFEQVLHLLGLDDVTVSQFVNNGFPGVIDTKIDTLLSDWGLNNLPMDTVIDRLGLNVTVNALLGDLGLNHVEIGSVIDSVLNHMTLGTIATDLGMNNVHLDDFLDGLLGNAKVGTLLDGLNLDSVPLDEIVQRLLGGVTVNDVATDLGLNHVTVDALVDALNLQGVTLTDVANDLGLSNLNLDSILANMGIAATDVISVSIGQLGGLFGF